MSGFVWNMSRVGLIAMAIAAPIAVFAHGSTRQKVTESVEINVPAETVWKAIGDFHDMSWLPGVITTEGGAKPEFAHRKLILQGGAAISESLTKYDADNMSYSYRIDDVDVKVLPVTNYSSTITVEPVEGNKSKVEWRGAFYRGDPNDNPPPELNDETSIAAVHALYRKGLDNVKQKLEVTKAEATH
ncbi:SRPBCC family protein [Methyloferula stellata]|uniref:SRPBCC family protein n=1 Tax=Methyloferula stellata TaxID=876270 RepID=UPI000478A4EF|nr:SRPBCC family protein [Methyloferula stellata]